VLESRVLRKTLEPKIDVVRGKIEEIVHHNEELYDIDCSPYTLRAMRSRRSRWAGLVARMGDRRDGFDG
jgi:hypothetical protein